MSRISERGINDLRGAVLVVYDEHPDRGGDPVPIVSLDYDLEAQKVVWSHNKRPPQRDDVAWKDTDWNGVQRVLDSDDLAKVSDARDRYRALFERLARAKLVDPEQVAKI